MFDENDERNLLIFLYLNKALDRKSAIEIADCPTYGLDLNRMRKRGLIKGKNELYLGDLGLTTAISEAIHVDHVP
jgi:hypothetical protein